MFEGFSPETVDFLWGIRLNNNREWFMDHKAQYTEFLYEPMKELGRTLFEPYLDEPGTVMKVSRIYRDARLHHPLPYKEGLWICIRRDVKWWGDSPCRYFEINPDGIHYGGGFWKPRAEKMEAFRKAIAREPEQFLELVCNTERETGVQITADEYKRPKPCPIPELERFYRWKGNISCICRETFNEESLSPKLAERAGEMIHAVTPLVAFLDQFGGE